MSQETFSYRFHDIILDIFQNGGAWGWRVQIDDEKAVTLYLSPAATASGALSEARAAAKSIIDLREIPL